MTQPNPEQIDRLLAEFQSKKKSVFEPLFPWQSLIEGLRQKGAAFEAIAALLRQQGLDTNREQIRRFCREELREPEKGTQRTRRKPHPLEIRPTDGADVSPSLTEKEPSTETPASAPENIQQTLDENRKHFLPGLPRRTGPRIANIKPTESK